MKKTPKKKFHQAALILINVHWLPMAVVLQSQPLHPDQVHISQSVLPHLALFSDLSCRQITNFRLQHIEAILTQFRIASVRDTNILGHVTLTYGAIKQISSYLYPFLRILDKLEHISLMT